MDTLFILNNIHDLLINRNWQFEESKAKYNIFVPPACLDFEKSYKLFIYNKIGNSDFKSECDKYLQIISQIYKEDIDDLRSIILEDRQILTIHIKKDDIIDGRPPLLFFDKLIGCSKELLQEVANFSVIQKQHYFENTEEAERYLNYCNFFKNDVGSLITKIQLPNKEEIKEKNLFSTAIQGYQINKQLLDVADFINKDIISSNNFEPTDDFLLQNKEYVSVNISEKLKKLYQEIDYSDIEISLKGTQINESSKTEGLNKEKVDNLSNFSKTVKEKMKDISENEVFGKIVELKSKDVDSDKNSITVDGKIKNVQSRITVILNSEQIKQAAESFKNNKTVKINAIFEKEKTQYRVKQLNDMHFL
jgi:hypothetical protein